MIEGGAAGARKVLGDIAGTVATRVALLPLALLGSILVARALQPEGKGIYTTVLTLVTFAVAVGALGVNKAATYHIARSGDESEPVRHAAFWISVWNGLLLAVILVGAAVWVAPDLIPGVPLDVLLLTAPMALVLLVRNTWEGFLRGEQRNHTVNFLGLAFTAAFVIAVAVIAAAGVLSPGLAMAARILGAIVAGGLGLWLLGYRRAGVRGPPVRRPLVTSLLAF
jgi:O-antigen/teichoic acid export membrane protein